jgi:hypothetical protein
LNGLDSEFSFEANASTYAPPDRQEYGFIDAGTKQGDTDLPLGRAQQDLTLGLSDAISHALAAWSSLVLRPDLFVAFLPDASFHQSSPFVMVRITWSTSLVARLQLGFFATSPHMRASTVNTIKRILAKVTVAIGSTSSLVKNGSGSKLYSTSEKMFSFNEHERLPDQTITAFMSTDLDSPRSVQLPRNGSGTFSTSLNTGFTMVDKASFLKHSGSSRRSMNSMAASAGSSSDFYSDSLHPLERARDRSQQKRVYPFTFPDKPIATILLQPSVKADSAVSGKFLENKCLCSWL